MDGMKNVDYVFLVLLMAILIISLGGLAVVLAWAA